MSSYQSGFEQEIARMEKERSSWQRAVAQTSTAAKIAVESVFGSNARLAKQVQALHLQAVAFAKQHQDVIAATPLGTRWLRCCAST